jgi:hypothetical protein
MIANLYLHTDSFLYNGSDTFEEFSSKFQKFVSDLSVMKVERGENIIYVTERFCVVNIFEDKTIFDLAVSLQTEEKNLLYSILGNTSQECDLSLDQLKSKCKYQEDESECHSIIVFNAPNTTTHSDQNYINFDEYEIVYNKSSWIYLRRQILGNHPQEANHFIEECKKYFPSLFFHDNNKEVVGKYLKYIPRKIIYYLSCLNDCFLNFRHSYENRENTNNMLRDFAFRYNMDDEASLQGNPSKRVDLIYKFPRKKDASLKEIHCEPHLKINKYDDNYKKKKTDDEDKFCARIYFHFGDPEIKENIILIGSIGPHI